MFLQENTLFDIEPKVKVTGNVAQYPLHHVTYAPVKFEVNTSTGGYEFSKKNTLFDLDFKVKVTQHVAQFPLHYVSYASAKFAVASSNGLRGDAFTRNVMDGPMNAHTDG